MQGLELKGGYLADVGAVAYGPATLHQGQVKEVIVDAVKGLFRADRWLEVEDDSPRGNLVAEQFSQLMAGVRRVAGCEREAIDTIPGLVKIQAHSRPQDRETRQHRHPPPHTAEIGFL